METEAARGRSAVETEAARGRNALLRLPPIGALRRMVGRRRPVLGLVWAVMAILVALYAAHEAFNLGGSGSDSFFEVWLNDVLLWATAVVCLTGALKQTRGRAAWLIVAVALTSWAIGDTIWSVRFGVQPRAPLTSVSDVFWLAWYPLVIAALVLLVRDRVPGFDLHRWIDGVAVTLVVATPWVALFLQPALAHAHVSSFARALDFIYPLGDAILFGATLGVFALMAWRPGRMWLVLGVALMVMALADAAYSVHASGSVHDHGIYDAAWVAGAALVAFAAWEPHPGQLKPRTVTGWSAIALPLAAQVLAISIQIYAFFHEIPRSERILTVVVLLISIIQIVSRRPRPATDAAQDRDPP